MYMAGLVFNHSVLPANIFDILLLTRSALTALLMRAGAQIVNAFSTRLYGKYFAEEHIFLKTWTAIYTNSIDLLILQEGL